jgi:hypothetical protein
MKKAIFLTLILNFFLIQISLSQITEYSEIYTNDNSDEITEYQFESINHTEDDFNQQTFKTSIDNSSYVTSNYSHLLSNDSQTESETLFQTYEDQFLTTPYSDYQNSETNESIFWINNTESSSESSFVLLNDTEINESTFNFTSSGDFTTNLIPSSTASPISLQTNEHKLDKSFVIVWEKCGQEARTQVTQIFQSIHYDKIVSVSYDPSINVLIYQVNDQGNKTKHVLKLPNIAGELLFFLFNEPGKINIFLGCPGSSKNRLVFNFDSQVK